jgi:hypothetical protein
MSRSGRELQRRYAVLGWGSLIWDLDNLAPHVRLPWAMAAGPRLPMEFSRISAKRRMGLAVCLDPEIGVPCPTHAIESVRERLDEAIGDLALRERAPRVGIGGVCLATGATQGREAIVATVRDWCREAGWHGAVWTDLMPNYVETAGEAFSIERVMAYLRRLSGDSLDEAVRYIENAPIATDTPLRRRLAADPWWRAQAARVDLGARMPSEAGG